MLILQGCSFNEPITKDDIVAASSIKCKTFTYTELTDHFREEFIYDGNKISEIKEYVNDIFDGNTIIYYDGNLPIAYKRYVKNKVLMWEGTSKYSNSGQLVSRIDLDWEGWKNVGTKTEYIYNSNGTITAKSYSGDEKNQTKLEYITTYTVVNDMIMSKSSVSGTDIRTETYTYDTKNGPFKNVIGLTIFDRGAWYGQKHNLIKEIVTSANFQHENIYEYTYNSDNFPTELRSCKTCSPIEYTY